MIRFIYKIIPIPIVYIDSLVDMAGKSYGIFISIKKEHKDNEALLQHELTHCRQFYRTLGLHSILYLLSSEYRLKSEIEAYRVTILYKRYISRFQSGWIVNTLIDDYNINITREEVERLLYD